MGRQVLLVGLLATCAFGEETSKKGCIRRTFGKIVYVRVGANAVFQHIRNSPHEWERGASGLGQRLGSAFAGRAVKNGIQFGVAKVLHEQIGYERSEKTGFWPRTRYALMSSVVTRKARTEKRTIAVSRISGAMGSGLISRLWMPARLHTVSSGLTTGGISLGVDAGFNVVREFWPEIRQRLPNRNKQLLKPSVAGATSEAVQRN